MSQPTLDGIFGLSSYYDPSIDALVIPAGALVAEQLVLSTALPIEILAVFIKNTFNQLSTNTDETVNLAISKNISSPSIRNDIEKTVFTFVLDFYGSYSAPTFDVNEL